MSEAKDIFQEGLISIFSKATNSDFVLTCPFEAYLFMICRSKWLNVLRSSKKRKETNVDLEGFNSVEAECQCEEALLTEERLSFLERKMNALDTSCVKLLKLSWSGVSMDEVANKLGLTYAYVRKKKSLCKSKLIELIRTDNDYNKYLE